MKFDTQYYDRVVELEVRGAGHVYIEITGPAAVGESAYLTPENAREIGEALIRFANTGSVKDKVPIGELEPGDRFERGPGLCGGIRVAASPVVCEVLDGRVPVILDRDPHRIDSMCPEIKVRPIEDTEAS